MSTRSIVLCLTGLLARSFSNTWPHIQKFIERLRKDNKFRVYIAVFSIDSESELVDGQVVSHTDAYKLLEESESESIVNYWVMSQNILDEHTSKSVYLRLPWLLCHGPRSISCAAKCKRNMGRHLQSEIACANFLKENFTNYDLAISLSPDVKLDINCCIEDILYNFKKTRGLLVPLCDSRNFITNGFCVGNLETVATFLEREWVQSRVFVNKCLNYVKQIRQHKKVYINWEMMCWFTCYFNNIIVEHLNVKLVKIRANGTESQAWTGNMRINY